VQFVNGSKITQQKVELKKKSVQEAGLFHLPAVGSGFPVVLRPPPLP